MRGGNVLIVRSLAPTADKDCLHIFSIVQFYCHGNLHMPTQRQKKRNTLEIRADWKANRCNYTAIKIEPFRWRYRLCDMDFLLCCFLFLCKKRALEWFSEVKAYCTWKCEFLNQSCAAGVKGSRLNPIWVTAEPLQRQTGIKAGVDHNPRFTTASEKQTDHPEESSDSASASGKTAQRLWDYIWWTCCKVLPEKLKGSHLKCCFCQFWCCSCVHS